jgi:hypothetical protein
MQFVVLERGIRLRHHPVSYSSAEASELPDSTTRLDPPSPTAEVPSNGTVLWCPMWKRGYGGLGLHRRKFPAHRRYLSSIVLTNL